MLLTHVPTSVKGLVEEMYTIFYQKMDNKGLDFKINIDQTIPSALLMDEIRLRQVLINLLGNAVKFTDQGTVTLSARAEVIDNENRVTLYLEIQDTGIGIPIDQQEKIFGAFEQVKGQDLKLYGGTGLGLAISNRLVLLMGGTLDLLSTPGKGSIFTISIPKVEITTDKALQNDSNYLNYNEIIFRPTTIIVADDIDFNREIITTFLNSWDFQIIQASNGKEAYDLAMKHHPDLIIMDMKMPVMDGYEASEKIHAEADLQNIPIIAVTASTLKRDENTINRISNDFIRKPLSKQILVSTLCKYIPHTVKEEIKSEAQNSETEVVQQSPSEEILKELLHFAEAGYFDRIKGTASELAKSEPAYQQFSKEIMALCNTFDDDGIIAYLDGKIQTQD